MGRRWCVDMSIGIWRYSRWRMCSPSPSCLYIRRTRNDTAHNSPPASPPHLFRSSWRKDAPEFHKSQESLRRQESEPGNGDVSVRLGPVPAAKGKRFCPVQTTLNGVGTGARIGVGLLSGYYSGPSSPSIVWIARCSYSATWRYMISCFQASAALRRRSLSDGLIASRPRWDEGRRRLGGAKGLRHDGTSGTWC